MNDLQQCLVINFRTSCTDDSQDKKDRLKEQKFEFYCFKKKSNLQIPQSFCLEISEIVCLSNIHFLIKCTIQMYQLK